MRILVCGGRDYNDKELFNRVMDRATKGIPTSRILIIQGGARGADKLAKEYALERGIQQEEYKANWNKLGKQAGIVRNITMLKESLPDIVIAFPGGAGTAHMERIARNANVKVVRVQFKKTITNKWTWI